jgi:nucleotide-binding universal stress UspA family protein
MTGAQPVRRPAISRVLLPVDFTPGSHQAAALARTIVRQYGARLWIAHVVEPVAAPDAAFIHSAGAMENAKHHMSRFVESESCDNVDFETVIRPGQFWPVLSQLANEHEIDLIIAGTHGRNWLSKMVLGSAAELMVRNAHCPVLTVSPRTHHTPSTGLLRVLVPLDAHSHPARALAYALALANENNSQVIFLHVLHRSAMPLDYPDEETIDDDRYSAAMGRLREIIPSAERFRREPEIIIDSGVPADVIVKSAMKTGADLIAMPVRRSASAAKVHAPWHTAYRVICHAACPVLTLAE